MYSFKVKSSIQDYTVEFISDYLQALKEIIKEGDYIFIDDTVANLYGSELAVLLDNNKHIKIAAKEANKSYQGAEAIIENLINNNFKRNNRIIAIGGGIIQDISAFIASILYRGVDWIFFPTTLLAQCDSCIGSKTSINFKEYKNQVGGFYPPKKIYIYKGFLSTLDTLEVKSGFGEMLHYYVLAGKNDFDFYQNSIAEAMKTRKNIEKLIFRSLDIKRKYVEIDEFDKNERQIFNYGHSFGHAIESTTEYKIPHGIAVSYGIDIANYIAVSFGKLNSEVREQIKLVTRQIWEGIDIETNFSFEKFISALKRDKKNKNQQFKFILINDFGKAEISLFDFDGPVISYLKQYFEKKIYL